MSIIHYTAVIDDAICDVKDEFFHVLSLLFFFAFQRTCPKGRFDN